jgi:DNA-binding MarR family transcriptional regulator
MKHELTIATLREIGELMEHSSPFDRIVLLTIVDAGEPVQMGHAAKRVGITTGAITQIADRLAAAGYVKRVRELTDRRSVHLEATTVGTKLVRRAEKAAEQVAAA